MIDQLRFALLLLLVPALPACAQSSAADGAWFSYRDTYRAMIRFEKYGQPKQFLENRLQVVAPDRRAAPEGTRLALEGKTVHLALPLDALGRALFPFQKAAYDENAELRVNRPSGSVALVPRLSIALRTDGMYDTADLRVACTQALDYLQSVSDPGASGKHCTGVAFSYLREDAKPAVTFRAAGRAPLPLPEREGAPFPDGAGSYRIVFYRFADWPDKGQVVTESAPLAIAAWYE